MKEDAIVFFCVDEMVLVDVAFDPQATFKFSKPLLKCFCVDVQIFFRMLTASSVLLFCSRLARRFSLRCNLRFSLSFRTARIRLASNWTRVVRADPV